MQTFMADISLWQFPASLIIGVAFLLGVWVLHTYCKRSMVYRLLEGGRAAVALLIIAAMVVAVEGTWSFGLHRTYPFIALIMLLTTNIGLAILKRLPQRNAAFLLNHAGLFIILWGSLFGAPDVVEARMVVNQGQSSNRAHTLKGEVVPFPFEVQLDCFTIEYYPDGRTPRQFRSELTIEGQKQTTQVNSPTRFGGYTIYQDSYDRKLGQYTVLLFSRDPWLWVVWLGVAMLAAGSILLIVGKR